MRKQTLSRGASNAALIVIVAVLIIGGGMLYFYQSKYEYNRASENYISDEMMRREYMLKQNRMMSDKNNMMEKTAVATLTMQNNSRQEGKATITDINGKAKIVLTVTGVPKGSRQPAHIHLNTCTAIGGVTYTLSDVVNGTSETMLDVSTADILNGLPLAINVHKSAKEAKIYVTCGDIKPSPIVNGSSMMDKNKTEMMP